jgi:outer membrane protein assembly factor BamB
MEKTVSIICLLFILTLNIFPQNNKYAWIPGIQFELPSQKNNLENIVKDINNKKEISFVIVTGNLSKNSKSEEIDSAKLILDELQVPYHIIPGFDDVKLNERCFREFKDLWNGDKFAFNSNGIEYIGINCGIFMQERGHFRIEDLQWLDSTLTKLADTEQVFFYSNFPAENGIDNLYEITNRLSTHNIKSILFSFQKLNPPGNVNGIPVLSETPAIVENSNWKYTIVENTTDSVFFSNVTDQGIQGISTRLPKITLKSNRVDSVQFINFTPNALNNETSVKANVLWKKELKETTIGTLVTSENNIYETTLNGNIFCFDNHGELEWENKSGESILSRLAVTDSIIVAGTVEGDLISFSAESGKIIQTIGLNESVTSPLLTIDAEYNGTPTTGIIAGTSHGSLYCYDIKSFEMIWENHSARELITSEPALTNERLIYCCRDGFIYCIDAASGIINWKLLINNSSNAPIQCKSVSDNKSIFVASPDKNIVSIDLMLGKVTWKKDIFNAYNSIGISESRENIYIKSCKDNFFIVSAKSGKLVKNIKIGFGIDPDPGNIIEWNKNILFSSQNGIIYLIDKNYKCNPLLFLGTGTIKDIINIRDNIFAASNIDGKIIVFRLE